MMKKFFAVVLTLALVASINSFGFTSYAASDATEEIRITEDAALQIALDAAKYSDKVVKYEKVWKDTDNETEVYKVEFYVGKVAFSYTIDIATGEIIGRTVKD